MVDRTKPLNIAVVGAGLMGRWHAAYAARSGGRITAIIDPDREAAARLAVRSARVFMDLESALAAQSYDVVHVCTPTKSHVEMISLALQGGSHVLAEKPIAPTARETNGLLERAAAQRLQLCPVHQMPFQDGALWAQQHLASIGDIVAINFSIRSAGGEGHDGQQLDAIAREILPHPLSILKSLLGIRLVDLLWRVDSPAEGEIAAYALCGKIMCAVQISMSARPTTHRCEVVGSKATLQLDLFHGYAVRRSGRVSRLHKIMQPFEEAGQTGLAAGINLVKRVVNWEPAYPGLLRLIRQFYSALRDESPTPIKPTEIVDVAQACEQIAIGI